MNLNFEETIYGYKEFCKLAGRSRETVDKWIKMGLVSNNKIAGKRYFTQADVDEIPGIKKEMNERGKREIL